MDKIEPTDEELARLVQSGNLDAFAMLVDRYQGKIERYAKKFVYDKDDIQDVIQDIFTKVYINIQTFDIKRKFSPWIYRIAHNELVNLLGKKKRAALPLFNIDVFFPRHLLNENSSRQELERKSMKDVVSKCLNKLEEKYREPVILFYLEEMDYKEISDIMQIPVSTVGTRINRAKKMMKPFLTNQGYAY